MRILTLLSYLSACCLFVACGAGVAPPPSEKHNPEETVFDAQIQAHEKAGNVQNMLNESTEKRKKESNAY